jgi:hypothetical protein
MGTAYYKPLTGVGDWQSVADSENISMHYMSIDPWGKSFYVADEEDGLILRYITTAGLAPVKTYCVNWEGHKQLVLVKEAT